MSDEELSLSEKRSAAAKVRWDNQGHPLFLYEPGEKADPIAFINVRRYGPNGPVDHQRVWPAAELMGEDDIFSMFGGGSYELVGRKAMPNGSPGNIVRKRRLMLEGDPKPFTGEAPGSRGEALAVAAPAHDPMAGFLAIMAEERRERRAEDQRRDEREAARSAQITQLLVGALGTVGSIVTAVLSRPQPMPQPMPDIAGAFQAGMAAISQFLPKPDTSDPLDRVAKILEVAKAIKPEDKGESVGDFMAGVGQAMQGFAQVEGMRIEAHRAGALAPPMVPQESPPPPHANGGVQHPPPPEPPPPGQLDASEVAGLAS
jgi:hypothetical protein